MKRYIVYILPLICCLSCLRLDDELYDNKKVDEYKWDFYTGQIDFELPASYSIPLQFMHELVLDSKAPNESSYTQIYGLYVGNMSQIATDTVILYCHGNSNHMDFYWPRAKLLANAGGKNRYGVMMIDYRGYGKSLGEPSEEGLYADVTAAINWLAQHGLTNDRLIIYGFSMGSAPAVYHCSKGKSANLHPSKLILENPFASADAMVQDAAVLTIPSEFVTNLELNNEQEIKSVVQPMQLWLSNEDKFLRKESHGEVIYGNHTGGNNERIYVPNADHSEAVHKYGFTNYANKISEFISN